MPKDHRIARGIRPAKFWVYGEGGHGREVAEAAGLADFITDETLDLVQEGDRFVVAIGDGVTRRKCAEKGNALGMTYSGVDCSFEKQQARFQGEGCIFMPGVVIMTGCTFGHGVLVNIGALIGHDCVLGNFCSIQPGVKMTGHVHVDKEAYIGIGATLICRDKEKPLKIGRGAVIGGGAIIFEDVPAGATVVGTNRRVK